MNETLGESLSAFLDGELPRAEYALLLRQIHADARLQEALNRYAVMGECLRGETVQVSRGFAARVQAAVAAEAAGRAPATGLLARDRRLRRAGQLAGGLALAATVAAAAILMLQPEQPLGGAGQEQTLAEADQGSGGTILLGQSGDEDFSYIVPSPAETSAVVPGRARLTDYVLAHSEYSNLMGRRNVLSSVIADDPTPVEPREPGSGDTP